MVCLLEEAATQGNESARSGKLENQVLEFMEQNSIAWYLRRPDDIFKWPHSLDRMVAYRCGDYRVYQFKTANLEKY